MADIVVIACCRNVRSPLMGAARRNNSDNFWDVSLSFAIQSHGCVYSLYLSFLVQAGHQISKTFSRPILKTRRLRLL